MPFILTFFVLWTSSIAFQSITVPNRALVGHVYRSLYDIDWINCIQSCQDDPNCASYNFVRLLNGLGQCQMIDCGLEDSCNTEGLVFSTGSIFQQITPTAGGKEICESSVHDHESHADFSLLFPSPQSVENYVEGRRIKEEFTKLSVCFWVKATSNHISVFSYRGTRGKKEMVLEIYDTNYLKLTVGEQSKNIVVNSVNDGHWHHICVAWENAEGQWAIFKDGSMVDNDIGFQVGYNIRPRGKLFIGQEQTREKNFDSKRSFVGELADFNFWPEYVTAIEVLRMSKSCINRKGDVYKWSKLRRRIKGKVVVIRPSSCRP